MGSARFRGQTVRIADSGFSLLEVVLALTISAVLLTSFLTLFDSFQKWNSDLQLLIERDENLWLSPLLLSRWLGPAGNNRWTQSWEGFSSTSGEVAVNSDIDGPAGFPDAALAGSFEMLVLRHSGSTLQLKSGTATFQPLLKNVSGFSVDGASLPLITIHLTAVSDRRLQGVNSDAVEAAVLSFYLWNYRSNLFAEAP